MYAWDFQGKKKWLQIGPPKGVDKDASPRWKP